MALTVYWGSGSAFAWRVLLALEVKNLAYDSKLISFEAKDNRAPGFLALNPRGKVPVLVDGDYVLYESEAILYYLDRKHPQPPLYGTSAEQAGAVMRSICEQNAYLETPLYDVVRPLYFGRIPDQADRVSAAVPLVAQELATIETRLGAQAWLATETLSAADLCLFPNVQTLRRALGKDTAAPLAAALLPFEERFPAIVRWTRSIESLPGYERTYPPHWR
ncbi:MAG: glutathione S-transferase family protein [Gammaproteobacteria bacterium]|nr:glutathione S-transferase family protein [Gammaproteobacteria bacterium]